jgi:signal transduction histidine kinase
MLYLRLFRSDSVHQWVPIADQTAAAIERALLAQERIPCQQEVLWALKRDPFLAAAACSVREENLLENGPATDSLVSLSALADWLSDGLASKFQTLLASPAETVSEVTPIDASHYAQLADHTLTAVGASSGIFPDRPSRAVWQSWLGELEILLSQCPSDPLGRPRKLPWLPPAAPRKSFATTAVNAEKSVENSGFFLNRVPGIAARLPSLVARLAKAEKMVATYELQLEQEKLASLKEFAYGASHEINNPLANITARAQSLLRDESDEMRRRKLSAIYDQAMRAHEMIADLMQFARPPALELGPCDLVSLVRQVVTELQKQAEDRKISLTLRTDHAQVFFTGDKTQLAVAVRAVVVNALEAVGQSGDVDVQLEPDHAQEVRIVVRDNGPGLTDELRRHMFDPFFSGREAGRGLGFGLSKCWRIVSEHGGNITVAPSPRSGTTITLILPANDVVRSAA